MKLDKVRHSWWQRSQNILLKYKHAQMQSELGTHAIHRQNHLTRLSPFMKAFFKQREKETIRSNIKLIKGLKNENRDNGP